MGILSIVLFVVAYIAVGGILAGFCHDRDHIIYYTLLWPTIVLYEIICFFGAIFYRSGEILRKLFDREDV